MSAESKTITEHETIRPWPEERVGAPAGVRGTDDDGDAGILRIDFPGGAGEESLEHISFDEWFDKFDEKNLAFIYQEEKAGGEGSTFSKLVNRDGDRPPVSAIPARQGGGG